jgi:drug/metabolite transporter (DMT)-like permease
MRDAWGMPATFTRDRAARPSIHKRPHLGDDATMPTKLLIVAVSINAVLGQLLLKRGIAALGGTAALALLPRFIVGALRSPWIYAAVAIQGFGYFLWMIVVSRVKLGVATAGVGGTFYLLLALAAWGLYGEALTSVQWLGIVLITVGVVCVSLTPR